MISRTKDDFDMIQPFLIVIGTRNQHGRKIATGCTPWSSYQNQYDWWRWWWCRYCCCWYRVIVFLIQGLLVNHYLHQICNSGARSCFVDGWLRMAKNSFGGQRGDKRLPWRRRRRHWKRNRQGIIFGRHGDWWLPLSFSKVQLDKRIIEGMVVAWKLGIFLYVLHSVWYLVRTTTT